MPVRKKGIPPPETYPPLIPSPSCKPFEKEKKKRKPTTIVSSSRALITHLPPHPRFIAFAFVPTSIPLRSGTLNGTKRATSSSRCLPRRCGAGGPSFVDGIAKRCRDALGERGDGEGRGEERRVESPLEGVDGEGEGREGEGGTALVVDTALEGRGWRKCGTSNSPGLPTPAFPTPSSSSPLSKRGARARAFHPPFANSSSRSIPFYRELRRSQGEGRRGIPIHNDNRYLNRRFRFINLRLHIASLSF